MSTYTRYAKVRRILFAEYLHYIPIWRWPAAYLRFLIDMRMQKAAYRLQEIRTGEKLV